MRGIIKNSAIQVMNDVLTYYDNIKGNIKSKVNNYNEKAYLMLKK